MTSYTYPNYPHTLVADLIDLLMQKGVISWLDLISYSSTEYDDKPQLELKTVPSWRVLKAGTLVMSAYHGIKRLTSDVRVFVGRTDRDDGRFPCFAKEKNNVGENLVFWVRATAI